MTSLGAGSPNNSIRIGPGARTTNMIDELKKKVASLEKELEEKDEKLRAVPDIDNVRVESEVVKKNNEILQGNVETMKALTVQLATQLDEANLQLATYKERQQIAALQLERDVTYEIENMKRDYETRLEELRKTLEETQQVVKKQQDSHTEREARQEAQHRNIVSEKDALIYSLTTQVEVLKTQIETQLQQQKEQGVARSNASKVRALRSRREAAAAANLSSDAEGGFASLSSGGRVAEKSIDDMKNVLALTLSVKRSDFEITRRIRGVGTPPLQGGHHFHADMASDPIILLPAGEVDGPVPGSHNTTDGRTMSAPAHSWLYTTVAGDKVTVSLTVESSPTNANESHV